MTSTNLGPMKYRIGDQVRFSPQGNCQVGEIKVADFGGSLEMLGKCHSYDIMGQFNGRACLYKHSPEADIEEVLTSK
ncbi:hypothetical protein [Lactiplantibacillus pingfangensis]|uniref:hypothetical protein n=1 Tax=Lactiplantibacillus pingfangensis TaxID=2559915 RepID=UPI0010F6A17E|nr:hypothetical protein [Lactiplantibacillus pingfangensis]